MAWGIPALVAGLGCLIALMGIVMVAYMKHRWFRYLALMFVVLFFGSQIMLLIFIPYVGIYGFVVQPPSTAWVFCLYLALYLFFLYWWSKFPSPCLSSSRYTPAFGDGLSRQRTRTRRTRRI